MERARSAGLPRGQKTAPELFGAEQLRILERIARGAPLSDVLRAIVSSIEQHSEGLCSILLLDAEHGALAHGAAPSLPAAYVKAIDGSRIGPAAGSCGSAAYLGQRVIVGDIATHPFWNDYRHIALPYGLRACWSTPVLSQAREVLGTFAVYYGQPREPTPQELSLVDSVTHLTAIAIMRERAEAEKKQLEAQVKLAQRMESLGTLAGGIAHEFNNILAAIIGYLELAQQELPAAHPVRERLGVVLSATDRAVDLVTQILAFSRRREIKRLPITLQPVVEEALRLLRATLPAMVEIRASLPAQNLTVLADASQVHQILLNLATNAVHAMDNRGVLSLSLAPVVVEARAGAREPITEARTGARQSVVAPRAAAREPDTLEPIPAPGRDVAPGRYMRLALSDDGSGMDAETLTRIFEPFFTTKQPGEGTGLGLSVVRGIVQEHGAALSVRSSPGVGTTFEIYFPEVQQGLSCARADLPLARVRSDGKRVLLVDDEHSLLALETQVLEGLGYSVEGYTDPGQALRSFAASPLAYDAIVTDFGMLGMTGIELAREVLRIRRDIPVVMTGGYLRPEETEEARGVGVSELLAKPDVIETLPRSLARLLPEGV